MANIKGIELASEVYDLEDETARSTATTAGQTATQASETATQASETATQADEKIGDLADLETTAKTDLVSAINEVATKDPPTGLTCGYYQSQIPADDAINFTSIKMGTLIGKNLPNLAVGQGVLLQGFTKKTNATECLPFSIFLRKTESGFSSSEAIADTNISINLFPASGTIYIYNSGASAVTLFLNVVGINASIIEG